MTRELSDVLFSINTEKFVEAHSNYLIEDEDLIAAVEEGMIDSDFVNLYAGVLNRMEEGTLTDEDQYMIYESFREGDMDADSYACLVESGLVDMDMTRDFLLEDFLYEANTAPVANAPKPSAQPAPQQQKPAAGAQPAQQKSAANNAAAATAQKKGTWDSVKQVANNVAGHAARGVGYVASKFGNHKFAGKAYGFAAKRFGAAGNEARQSQAKANAQKQGHIAAAKMSAQQQTQNKINQINANKTQKPAANDPNKNKQPQQPAQSAQPAPQQQQTKEGLDYSLLHTLDVSRLI